MINLFYEEVSDNQVDVSNISNWIHHLCELKNCIVSDINFIFCSDKYILNINQQFLNHDYYTDIITFDYCDGKVLNGDIYISVETVLSNSELFNTTYDEELHRVIIHGILHLIGYKDKTDDEALEMRQQEDSALELLKTFS